jgi:hypothetical protein
MSQRLKLRLLASLRTKTASDGYTITPAVLLVMGLVVGGLGVVALSNWSSLSALLPGTDAREIADMGADRIIAYWSDNAQNRQLLVAGSTAPSTWSTTNTALQSPCVSSQSTRPGGTGFPTSLAVALKDGQFRNLDNMTQVGTGTQRFRLVAVRYTTGPNTGTTAELRNRRSIYRTFTAAATPTWSQTSALGTLPTGSNFNQLINLDDPDGGGSLAGGNNTGSIAITVEGRVYKSDGTYSTYITTKEYEILPKCCGGSLGGNDSRSLGADTRFCGVEFGIVAGINGGRFFSQQANDRYTTRNASNQVVNLASLVGVVAAPTHTWTRYSVSPLFNGSQIGCRTVPSLCNVGSDTGDRIPGDANSIRNSYGIPGTGGTTTSVPGPCPYTTLSGSNTYGDQKSIDGRAAGCIPFAPIYFSTGLPSIASRYTYNWTANGNPDIVSRTAVNSSNLPTSYGGYPSFIINGSGNGDDTLRIWLRANSSNQLAVASSPASPTASNPAVTTPYLEYCNTKYLPSNQCASVFPSGGSNIHTWAVVSQGGVVPTSNTAGIAIGDTFNNSTAVTTPETGFAGYAAGSTPRWPSIWTERDQNGMGITTGDMLIRNITTPTAIGSAVTFNDIGTDQGATVTNRPAIARAVNLYALSNPVLEFTFTRSRASAAASTSALRLDYGFTSPITTNPAIGTAGGTDPAGWVQLATVTADGVVAVSNSATNRSTGTSGACARTTTGPYSSSLTAAPGPLFTCRIQLPAAATGAANRFNHYVKFRLSANSNLGSATTDGTSSTVANDHISEINLTKVEIKSYNTSTSATERPSYLNWCEYSSSFPITANFTGGFHCLGPAIDMRAVLGGTGANSSLSSNRFWLDTTDASISFYYNRTEDTRGTSSVLPVVAANSAATSGVGGPLIVLSQGASLANVRCTRANPTTTAPTENCTTLIPENVFNPVGEYDRFNIFGRDTSPAPTSCTEFGVAGKPCMQVIALGADSSTTSTAGRARIAGAWIYMPWGLVGFRVNACGGLNPLDISELNTDDSWNYGGRLWARSIYACGQNHFRVPPSSSASLSALIGSSSSSDINYVGWTGQDWVARSTSGTVIGSLN